MNEILKPCPCCKKPARFSYGEENGELFLFAMCCSCGIRTPKFYYVENETKSELCEAKMMVAKRWNRRANESNTND